MTDNVILGSYGFGNLGDRAILENIIEKYEGETTVTCYRKDWIDIDVRKRHYWDPGLVKDVMKSDKVAVGGEPVLDAQVNESVNLLSYYILMILILGRFTGSKVVLEGVGYYQPNLVTRWLLGIADPEEIRCRDRRSLERLEEEGFDPVIVKDPALEETEVADTGDVERILVNVRYVANDELDSRTEEVFGEVIERLQEEYELTGFSTQPVHDNLGLTVDPDIETDADALETVGLPIERGTSSIEEIREKIASTDMVIAYRLHSVIFALNENVPVLAVSYHPKVRELCERYGVEYIEHSKLSVDRVIERLENQFLR